MAASNQTVVVRLPGVLVDLFSGAPRRLEMTAATVAEVIDELDRQFPGMGDRLRDTRPAIRKHINVFVDGDKLKLNAPLQAGCEVFILTAISGG
ncbi:MoaD/ThiS family protein [Corticibacterium sp. UT-5YL-CI-8]|nr:MoaD/ThiS family protein [Tianweitania sp. UT-5YL-CI-8]